MIHVIVHRQNDSELARVWMRVPPREGELLWFTGSEAEAMRDGEEASSSFTVTEVAHWVGTNWSPNTHGGEPVHSMCVYVKATRKDVTE